MRVILPAGFVRKQSWSEAELRDALETFHREQESLDAPPPHDCGGSGWSTEFRVAVDLVVAASGVGAGEHDEAAAESASDYEAQRGRNIARNEQQLRALGLHGQATSGLLPRRGAAASASRKRSAAAAPPSAPSRKSARLAKAPAAGCPEPATGTDLKLKKKMDAHGASKRARRLGPAPAAASSAVPAPAGAAAITAAVQAGTTGYGRPNVVHRTLGSQLTLDFGWRVRHVVRAIPAGSVASYGQVGGVRATIALSAR
jgi:hypothetical protein